jgi:hypothetical protein
MIGSSLFDIKSEKSRLFQRDFPPEEFKERRDRVLNAIGQDACAIVQGSGYSYSAFPKHE